MKEYIGSLGVGRVLVKRKQAYLGPSVTDFGPLLCMPLAHVILRLDQLQTKFSKVLPEKGRLN